MPFASSINPAAPLRSARALTNSAKCAEAKRIHQLFCDQQNRPGNEPRRTEAKRALNRTTADASPTRAAGILAFHPSFLIPALFKTKQLTRSRVRLIIFPHRPSKPAARLRIGFVPIAPPASAPRSPPESPADTRSSATPQCCPERSREGRSGDPRYQTSLRLSCSRRAWVPSGKPPSAVPTP